MKSFVATQALSLSPSLSPFLFLYFGIFSSTRAVCGHICTRSTFNVQSIGVNGDAIGWQTPTAPLGKHWRKGLIQTTSKSMRICMYFCIYLSMGQVFFFFFSLFNTMMTGSTHFRYARCFFQGFGRNFAFQFPYFVVIAYFFLCYYFVFARKSTRKCSGRWLHIFVVYKNE